MSIRNSGLARLCLRRYCRLREDQRLSTIELEFIIGTSGQIALAQITYLDGLYQFVHKYSQAQACPAFLQARCISAVCSLHTSCGSIFATSSCENTGR